MINLEDVHNILVEILVLNILFCFHLCVLHVASLTSRSSQPLQTNRVMNPTRWPWWLDELLPSALPWVPCCKRCNVSTQSGGGGAWTFFNAILCFNGAKGDMYRHVSSLAIVYRTFQNQKKKDYNFSGNLDNDCGLIEGNIISWWDCPALS